MALTIRWRLTLWNTLALALMLLGFGALVYGLTARTHRRIDEALQRRADEALQRVDDVLLGAARQLQQDPKMTEDRGERLRHWIYEFREHEQVFCVVYDTRGDVYLRTEELAAASVPPPPDVARGEVRFQEATVPVLGRQRVLIRRLRLGGEDYTVLLMAALADVDRARQETERERAEVDREIGRFQAVLLTAAPLALVLVGGTGYVLARKALAPVDQLHRLTEEITAERLDRRLPAAHRRDELGRLALTINAMIGRLERSFAEVRRFTADASHELRTPLTAIRTEAEVALARPLTLEQHQHLLASILEECERLTRLTDQLLALSREDAAGTAQAREPVDLAALVGRVLETMRPLAEAKGLSLEQRTVGPLRVRGDEARLRQVFYNLLDNALKYTPPGGTVEVGLERRSQHAVVTVRDSGIGIPAEHLPHVFERFYRVDKARGREQGGTGLGLSIVRSIVTAHGGDVHLASTPGRGTTCIVTLPAEAG